MIELKYHQSSSTYNPALLDTTSSQYSVFIRKNVRTEQVKEDPLDEDSPTVTMYVYDEAILDKSEYAMYVDEVANETKHDEIDLGIADLAETTDGQYTEGLLAMAELAETADDTNTDLMLAITEATEALTAQIEALQARIEALEAKNV